MEQYGFPKVSTFLELEKETFSNLHKSTWINLHPKLHGPISSTFSKISSGTLCINFEGEFMAVIEKKNRSVCVGSKVECENNKIKNISFHYAIMESEYSKKVLRKVHFDVAVPGQIGKKNQPLYHFQVGGEDTPLLEKKGVNLAPLEPWFSYPRWPHYPLSTALFLDIVFREIGDDNLKTFIGEGGWRRLIKENEKTIWLPFFNLATDILQSNSSLLMDKFYES